MMLAVDSSGWLARFLQGPFHQLAVTTFSSHESWGASSLALSESLVALARLDADPTQSVAMAQLMRHDWGMVYSVPVDAAILDHATELSTNSFIRLSDAIHLASAARLPKPVSFLTFDAAQIPAALELGLDVISTLAADS